MKKKSNMPAKFPLRQTVITPGARDDLNPEDVQAALRRHASGDWGDLDDHERREKDFPPNQDGRAVGIPASCGHGLRELRATRPMSSAVAYAMDSSVSLDFMADVFNTPLRVIMRIELLPQAKKQLMGYCSRLGMTQVATTSRLIEWLCQETDVVQAGVLGLYPEDIQAKLPSMILRGMAAGKKN